MKKIMKPTKTIHISGIPVRFLFVADVNFHIVFFRVANHPMT